MELETVSVGTSPEEVPVIVAIPLPTSSMACWRHMYFESSLAALQHCWMTPYWEPQAVQMASMHSEGDFVVQSIALSQFSRAKRVSEEPQTIGTRRMEERRMMEVCISLGFKVCSEAMMERLSYMPLRMDTTSDDCKSYY